MRTPRLRRALAASAVVHVGALAGLLALAHPRFQAAPAMRVALLGQPGTAGGPDRSHEPSGGARPGVAAAERPSPAVDPVPVPARPPPSRSSTRVSRRTDARAPGAEGAGEGAAAGAEALVSAVQSDVWVLAAGAPGPAGAAPATGTAAASTAGPAPGDGSDPGAGQGGRGDASLLSALSQRLAWSAARCAPAEVVRAARHAVPGVPLHFCLDDAGRPSDVGLLGTTGSDVLDRAARDCVVPGALPLPAVPGCYTVEVRFPTRG